jgi:hypothetical protein
MVHPTMSDDQFGPTCWPRVNVVSTFLLLPQSHPSPCALNAERNCAFSVKCAFAICAAERGQLLEVYECNITNIHCSFI